MFEQFRLAVLGLILGITTSMLTGCGQKGPLYLQSEFDQEMEDAAAEVQQRDEALEREEAQAIGSGVGAHQDAGSLIPPP